MFESCYECSMVILFSHCNLKACFSLYTDIMLFFRDILIYMKNTFKEATKYNLTARINCFGDGETFFNVIVFFLSHIKQLRVTNFKV